MQYNLTAQIESVQDKSNLVYTKRFWNNHKVCSKSNVRIHSPPPPPEKKMWQQENNKGNAKRGVSPRLKIWPGDLDLWSMTLKRVPDSLKDWACTKFGQNPLKDVDSSVHKNVMR